MLVRTGLTFAVVSALCFGLAGPTASVLLGSGWTAGAAVEARVAVGAIVLTPPALAALRGRWRLSAAQARLVVAYGVVAVAGAQLCYFYAVSYLPVGVALLIEYTSPVAVVVWMWARHGQRPTKLTVVGGVIALIGLSLLIDAFGYGPALDPRGVAWALAAMVGATAYFVISARDDTGLPPIALAWVGLAVATLVLAVIGALGGLPMRTSTAEVTFRTVAVPWFVPVLVLGIVTAAAAYLTGIAAVRRLGARFASFVGLTEVLAAVLFAWLLVAQVPSAVQVVGGALILLGVIVVKSGERDVPA